MFPKRFIGIVWIAAFASWTCQGTLIEEYNFDWDNEGSLSGTLDGPADASPTETPEQTETPQTPADPGLPCEVRSILEAKCQFCHGETPSYGAPNPLTKWEDFHTKSMIYEGTTVLDHIVSRVTGDDNIMPPPPSPPLDQNEIATLQSWVDAGAPRSSCDTGSQSPGNVPPPEETPEEQSCDWSVELLAHGSPQPNDSTPYEVTQSTDSYICFVVKVPWGTTPAQALRFRPVVDDTRVLHHWLLYAQNGGLRDGDIHGCNGRHANAALVAGWAPGGGDIVMPENVGQRLPSGDDAYLILEIHYNNSGGYTDALDRSGVEICATKELQQYEAAPHWLGSERILMLGGGDHDVTGTCTPQLTETAFILSSTPHMHLLGKHMKTTINRGDGSKEVLHDAPFRFEDQVSYPTPTEIRPGDTLTTTCTFNNSTGRPVTFGSDTENEMCYNFVLAYPAGSFNTGGALGGNAGDNFCLR
jgi:hypothetical protein